MKEANLLVHDLLTPRGAKTRLAEELGVRPWAVSQALQRSRFSFKLREAWLPAINRIYGADYTFQELFSPVMPREADREVEVSDIWLPNSDEASEPQHLPDSES